MQKQQLKNTILFVVLMVLTFLVWLGLKTWVFPPPPAPPPPAPAEARLAAAAVGTSADGWAQVMWLPAHLAPEKTPAETTKPVEPPKPAVAEKPPEPITSDQLVTLGDKNRDSAYHLGVVLTPLGGGVQAVTLNKFQKADEYGRPVPPTGPPEPLDLIPADNESPSNLLYLFDVNKPDDDKPFIALGKEKWKATVVVPVEGGEGQQVSFESPESQGLVVTKTYTLRPGEYHLGLEVKVRRVAPEVPGAKPLKVRYQLTAGHGLPIEGRWYTNTFRNALIGQTEKGNASVYRGVQRELQDLRQMAVWEGGNAVPRAPDYLIRYAGVAVQYFASVIVVDNAQEKQDYLIQARPTLETAVVKGVVQKVDPDRNNFALVRDDNHQEQTFRIHEQDKLKFLDLQDGLPVAVLYDSGAYDEAAQSYPEYARELRTKADTQPLWEDDVTVRVNTEAVEMTKPGDEVVHKYLLYNGPVKTMLLSQMGGKEAVSPQLVSHYLDDLNLNTLTDYPSNNWFSYYVTGPLRISWLLIQITNVMHWVLWSLHYYLYIPYILCIVCLTILVRGVMFPVSRKQALTSLRMQQLAPELKKLQEKFKEDKQGMASAQMELYRKNGVNPFGTCWLLLLQMPIFMGLYYSLQESIHFRLASVSPWWIPNLAAPDMLVWWSNSIPYISQPSSYGWILYLGPYLNVLPILAVSLMLVQQKLTMPPPTDEQQETQQKMMKYMMVFMGLMFYKVASGLCIYFIASSLWGFAERRLLPKKKPAPGMPELPDKPGLISRYLMPKSADATGVTTGPATGVVGKPETPSLRLFQGENRGGKGKRGKRRQEKARTRADGDGPGDGSMFQRLRDWWDDILKQAQKK